MKRILVLALFAMTSLVASPAFAANSPIASSGFLSSLVAGTASEKDISALFNAVGLTATSVSANSSLGSFSFLDYGSKKAAKHVEYTVLGGTHTLGLALGKKNQILGIKLDPIRPPSSRPIPEARTMVLYLLGALAIGWVLVRSRRTAATHTS